MWDVATDKHAPLCDQKVVKKAKATHIAFNARGAPVLLAADSTGGVVSLKLSPNLRKLTPIPMPPVRKVGRKAGRGGGGSFHGICRSEAWTRRCPRPPPVSIPQSTHVAPLPAPRFVQGEVPPPAPSRAEVEVRKLDAWLALSDAKISIVTAVPGQAGPAAAAAGATGDGAADEESIE